MINEHDIYRSYPKSGFKGFALSAIRVALQSTSGALLLELTRRYRETWRNHDLAKCPYCYDWIRRRGYLDDPTTWGPQRVIKLPDKPVYEQIDLARAHGAPDAQLEAETLRKI